jgi:hypothetical protein
MEERVMSAWTVRPFTAEEKVIEDKDVKANQIFRIQI